MAFTEYLKINGELLPFPDSYDLSLSSVESDSAGQPHEKITEIC